MSMDATARSLAKKVAPLVLGPLLTRLGYLRRDVVELQAARASLAAEIEQLKAAQFRLYAYFDQVREELDGQVEEGTAPARALIDAFARGAADDGDRADEMPDVMARIGALSEAGDLAERARRALADSSGRLREHDEAILELRSSNRLSQALVERLVEASEASGFGDAAVESVSDVRPSRSPAPAAAAFINPAPSFSLLYRAFEDRHRGSEADVIARQEEDYLELLRGAPDGLPVVDLGCGRGELVELLGSEGVDAIGVDSNVSQIQGLDRDRFVEADLFDWLDRRDDGTVGAVVSLHVVEHLPLDLQVRLVFEAGRVLAPGGLLVLETPNALSITTGASSFWTDPTHERPVHPLFLEFLAIEAGYSEVEILPLHPVGRELRGADEAPRLIDDLEGLLFGAGDVALVARKPS